MAKIIYKKGCNEQNKLSCIEGIEIDLLNGQKALIYPKYDEKTILLYHNKRLWKSKGVSEIEALRVKSTDSHCALLRTAGSPAADYAHQFASKKYGNFALPSLLAAMEIQRQKKEIDALAKTVEDADLLEYYTSITWSCSKSDRYGFWCCYGNSGFANYSSRFGEYLTIPTILYSSFASKKRSI